MRAISSWACLFLLSGLSASQEAPVYTIKVKSEADVGKSVLIHTTDRTVKSTKDFDATGKLAKENKDLSIEEEIFTETLLEKGDKHRQKFKRVYTKAIRGDDKMTTPLSYQNRTVLFEFRAGKYLVSVEGKPALPDDDLQALTDEANDELEDPSDEDFVAKKAVKIGETWKLENKVIEKLGKRWGELDTSKAKGHSKLVKVYGKDGKQFGVIESQINFEIMQMGTCKFNPPAKAIIKTTVDRVIDGSSLAGKLEVIASMKGKGQVKEPGMTFMQEFSMDYSREVEQSAEK